MSASSYAVILQAEWAVRFFAILARLWRVVVSSDTYWTQKRLKEQQDTRFTQQAGRVVEPSGRAGLTPPALRKERSNERRTTKNARLRKERSHTPLADGLANARELEHQTHSATTKNNEHGTTHTEQNTCLGTHTKTNSWKLL